MEPRVVVMMAVDRLSAFFGSGMGDTGHGRVRDAAMASHVACCGLTVLRTPPERKLSVTSSSVSARAVMR